MTFANKTMKKHVIGITTAAALFTWTAVAGELKWLTDAGKAQQQAKAESKLVLLDFTGSDWCRWCIKLNKEVFSTPEFAEYAKKHLVLVEVDFPRRKPLGEDQQRANKALAQKYGVRGYPTLILLDGAGTKLAALSYEDGLENKDQTDVNKLVAKPAPFIAAIEKAAKKP